MVVLARGAPAQWVLNRDHVQEGSEPIITILACTATVLDPCWQQEICQEFAAQSTILALVQKSSSLVVQNKKSPAFDSAGLSDGVQ